MATRIFIAGGATLDVVDDIDSIIKDLAGPEKVFEYALLADDRRTLVAKAHFAGAHEINAAPGAALTPGDKRGYYAFRGTRKPVNAANGAPEVVELSARGENRDRALKALERQLAEAGYRLELITAEAGPEYLGTEAVAKLSPAATA